MSEGATIETYTTIGGTFSVDTVTDARMARVLRNGQYHQKDVIFLLSAFFDKGDVIVDAGAHIGTISIPLALKGANVVSFEPSDDAYALLTRNVAANKASVDARKKGLGAAPSRARLVEGEKGNAGSRSLEEGEGGIEVVRLDDEVDVAAAIKMDVEGMELSVLRGAQKLIQKSHPVILFEMNLSQMRKYKATSQAIQAFLESRGYELFYQININDEQRLGKVGRLSLLTLSIVPGTVLFGRHSYAFDILAVPKGRTLPFKTMSATGLHTRIAMRKIADIFARWFVK